MVEFLLYQGKCKEILHFCKVVKYSSQCAAIMAQKIWWYDGKVKPHSRYLEWGFHVTPTESLFYGKLQ